MTNLRGQTTPQPWQAIPGRRGQLILTWLTVERVAYLAIGLLALALRLVALGQQPFSPAEAEQAVAALDRLRHASALPPAGVSPILLSLQVLTFFLAEPSEALARLWPAFAGVLLVLLPYALRRELGRVAALATSFLLAISASLTYWSRSATGESFAWLAVLALFVVIVRLRQAPAARREAWLPWAAAALALLFLSAPLGYSGLLALAACLLVLTTSAARPSIRRAPGPTAPPANPASAVPPASDSRSPASAALTRSAAIFVALLVLGSTALLLNPSGLAAVADLPAVWLQQFSQSNGYSALEIAVRFALAEPLLLALGLAGLAWSTRRGASRRRLALGLGAWTALALLLAVIRAGRTPADMALLALPLALLGGQAIAAWSDAATQPSNAPWRGQELEALVLLIVGVALLGSLAIWLAQYAASGVQTLVPAFLISVLVVVVAALGVLLIYALLFGARLTGHIALALLFLALLLPSLRATVELSHNTDGLRWGSPLRTVGAADGRNLTEFLEQTATGRGSDLRDLKVGLIAAPGNAPAPLLRWYARHANVRVLAGAASADPDEVLISLASEPLAAADLSGRSFRLTQTWSFQGLAGGPLWRWLLYGHVDALDDQQRAVVWIAGASAE